MNVLSYTEVQLSKEILHTTFKEKNINSVIPSMEIGNRRKKARKSRNKQASYLLNKTS